MGIDQIFDLMASEKKVELISQFQGVFSRYLDDAWFSLTELEKFRKIKELEEFFK